MALTTQGRGKKALFTEINITPLTDIFLVLLIIMMVIAPMFQSINADIEMPEITAGSAVQTDKVVVSITKEPIFFVNDKQVEAQNLEIELKMLFDNELKADEEAKQELFLRADKATKNKEIMKVMRAAKNIGYHKLTVVGEPFSADQQEDLKQS